MSMGSMVFRKIGEHICQTKRRRFNMFKEKFLILFAVFFMGIVFSLSSYGKDEDSFDCPRAKYVGDINKRGNVRNATMAFDLLLNKEDRNVRDALLSTSFLKEKNKPIDYYAPWKAHDNNKKTAWVEGTKGSGIGEKIYCSLLGFPLDEVCKFLVDFVIINGYARDNKLFKANNRVKRAKLTVYEAQWDICGGYYSQRVGKVMKNSSKIVEIRDSPDEQTISIDVAGLKFVKKKSGSPVMFMAELEILDVYRGTKFNDTCISEFRVSKVDKEKVVRKNSKN